MVEFHNNRLRQELQRLNHLSQSHLLWVPTPQFFPQAARKLLNHSDIPSVITDLPTNQILHPGRRVET